MTSHRPASKRATSAETTARPPLPTEVRELREAYQMTPLAAAQLVFVSERSWKEWEAGTRPMKRAYWELFKIKAKNAQFLRAFIADDPVSAATYTRKPD
jgi:DNA-binding transcriptional regulator YiaG